MPVNDTKDLHAAALAVHGTLAALHLLLGTLYNVRRGNRGWALFHLGAGAASAYATYRHHQKLREA